MIEALTGDELLVMREAGKAAATALKKLRKVIKPGITTKDIENFFENFLARYPGMSAAFKGYKGYPAALCVSINEEIIHGIPAAERLVANGDLVSVDLGIKYKGLYVDTAYTYMVGKVPPQARKLVAVSLKSLLFGIKRARIGATVGDIGSCIQECVETNGFSVIRKFVGHGIGKMLHCAPEVPNFGHTGSGASLVENTAIAIEPMVSAGGYDLDILSDGWTAKTKDNSLSAHFEHTVAITKKGPWVLTA
ncbi:MAG: type I methionyl aminopeptidase [Candidatus Omnitrophica bacterium]|nr:type I methionyl aminopeptidase [Candidatus Omnitrophota bacterium]